VLSMSRLRDAIVTIPAAPCATGAGIGVSMVAFGFVAGGGQAILAGVWVLSAATAVAMALDAFRPR